MFSQYTLIKPYFLIFLWKGEGKNDQGFKLSASSWGNVFQQDIGHRKCEILKMVCKNPQVKVSEVWRFGEILCKNLQCQKWKRGGMLCRSAFNLDFFFFFSLRPISIKSAEIIFTIVPREVCEKTILSFLLLPEVAKRVCLCVCARAYTTTTPNE